MRKRNKIMQKVSGVPNVLFLFYPRLNVGIYLYLYIFWYLRMGTSPFEELFLSRAMFVLDDFHSLGDALCFVFKCCFCFLMKQESLLICCSNWNPIYTFVVFCDYNLEALHLLAGPFWASGFEGNKIYLDMRSGCDVFSLHSHHTHISHTRLTHSNLTHTSHTLKSHTHISHTQISHTHVTYTNLTHTNLTHTNFTHMCPIWIRPLACFHGPLRGYCVMWWPSTKDLKTVLKVNLCNNLTLFEVWFYRQIVLVPSLNSFW